MRWVIISSIIIRMSFFTKLFGGEEKPKAAPVAAKSEAEVIA
jgi:hypothetical protein